MSDHTDADAAGTTEGADDQPSPGRTEGPDDAPSRDEPEDFDRGARVGRYLVLDIIGEGGMGVVYSAYDPELDRKVAIKLLQIGGGGSQGDLQAWLLREAQALARLAHPNVVNVHDVGTLPGNRMFVAMELVAGGTLRKWLKAQQRAWRDVLPVMIDAGKGLAAAHAAGLVHRDFKPDNVIVGNDGRVRVMDFGLARLAPSNEAPAKRTSDLSIETRSPLAENLTVIGAVVGTPAYLAPELYAGQQAGAASDQFAFGVTLFEALFRTRPFTREELNSRTPPKPKVPTDTKVPARIQRAVLRAIAIDPAQRFPTMDALINELAVDPHAARRRLLIAAGIVAVGAASVGGVMLLAGKTPEPCLGIEQRLAGVWDPPIKEKIHKSFVATGRPYAAKAFAELERSLDAYTSAWTTTSVESCRATRVRKDQTEEVLSLRQSCLDQRLEEVHALAALLVESSPQLVDKAEKIGGELEPIALCSNVAVLRAPGVPPDDVAMKLAPLRKYIADARANMIAGRYLPAMVASQKASDLARSVKHEPSIAEAELVRGAALLSTGNAAEAAMAYEKGAWSALRGRRDDLVVGAALMEAMVSAETLGKVDEAKVWLELAEATAARTGVERVYEHRMYSAKGIVAALANDNETAIAAHERAYAAALRTSSAGVGVWGDEVLLATTLTRAHIYNKAVYHFEHAMAQREKIVGPDHADIAVILTNLGIAYKSIGMKDKAAAAFERALKIREKTYGANSPLLVTTLNNYADLMKSNGNYVRALELVDRSLALAAVLPGREHPIYQSVATTRAEILAGMGKVAEARKLFDELVLLETKLHSASLTDTLTARAEVELRERAWADAARFAERTVGELERAGGSSNPGLVTPLVVLAQAKAGLGDAAAAKEHVDRAIALGEKSGTSTFELARARKLRASLPN